MSTKNKRLSRETRALQTLMRRIMQACNESGFVCEEPPPDLPHALCIISRADENHTLESLVVLLDWDAEHRATFLSTDIVVTFPDMVVQESDVMTQSVMQAAADAMRQAYCTAIATGESCYYVQHFELPVTHTLSTDEIATCLYSIEIAEMVLRTIVATMVIVADTEALDESFSAFDPFDA